MSERIYTRCPACLNDTLTINNGHLLCTWIKCPDPTLIDRTQPETGKDVKSCPTGENTSVSNPAAPESNPPGGGTDAIADFINRQRRMTDDERKSIDAFVQSKLRGTPRTDAAIEEFEYSTVMLGGEIGGGSREIGDPNFARTLEHGLNSIASMLCIVDEDIGKLTLDDLISAMQEIVAVNAQHTAALKRELATFTAEKKAAAPDKAT